MGVGVGMCGGEFAGLAAGHASFVIGHWSFVIGHLVAD
jgi:hypothetical protein